MVTPTGVSSTMRSTRSSSARSWLATTHAAPPARQQFGDRLPAIGIEIVGGLVQQQHVRRLDQQARQRHARPFAAAQRREPAIHRQRGQAGFDQRRLDPAFQRPVGLGGVLERAVATF